MIWILLLVYTIILALIRKKILNKIFRLMSKNVDQDNTEIIYLPDTKEVATNERLQFIKLNVDSELMEANHTRKEKVSILKRDYYKRVLFEFIFLILYYLIGLKLIIFYGGYKLDDAYIEPEVDLYHFNALGGLVPTFAFWLIIWTLIKFLGSVYRFRAYKNKLFNILKPIWSFIYYLFISRIGFPLYLLFGISGIALIIKILTSFNTFKVNTQQTIYIYLPLFIAVALIHLYVLNYFRKKSRFRPNIKLLILRVFGEDLVSKNIFTKLARYWQLFGSYFTVVDKSFYRVYWKRAFNRNIGIFIFLNIVVIVVFGTIMGELQMKLGKESATVDIFGYMLLICLCIPFFLINYYSRQKIKKDLISSEVRLIERLKELQKNPTNIDHSFKSVPLLCYNDTWKMAVNKMSKIVDMILMDLRGFSESNKGCEYEVNFLFDHVPIEKILFITDLDSLSMIENLLVKQWEMLIETSPNLNVFNPKVKIYITSKLGAENVLTLNKVKSKDTQAIVDTLLYYAKSKE